MPYYQVRHYYHAIPPQEQPLDDQQSTPETQESTPSNIISSHEVVKIDAKDECLEKIEKVALNSIPRRNTAKLSLACCCIIVLIGVGWLIWKYGPFGEVGKPTCRGLTCPMG
jgi:hypothetical protein